MISMDPLHYFARDSKDDVSMIDALIKKGCDVNSRTQHERTALMICPGNANSADKIRKLISVGARVNCVDEDGVSALHFACHKNDEDAIRILVENGASLCAKTTRGGMYSQLPGWATPLDLYGGSNDEIVKLLKEKEESDSSDSDKELVDEIDALKKRIVELENENESLRRRMRCDCVKDFVY